MAAAPTGSYERKRKRAAAAITPKAMASGWTAAVVAALDPLLCGISGVIQTVVNYTVELTLIEIWNSSTTDQHFPIEHFPIEVMEYDLLSDPMKPRAGQSVQTLARGEEPILSSDRPGNKLLAVLESANDDHGILLHRAIKCTVANRTVYAFTTIPWPIWATIKWCPARNARIAVPVDGKILFFFVEQTWQLELHGDDDLSEQNRVEPTYKWTERQVQNEGGWIDRLAGGHPTTTDYNIIGTDGDHIVYLNENNPCRADSCLARWDEKQHTNQPPARFESDDDGEPLLNDDGDDDWHVDSRAAIMVWKSNIVFLFGASTSDNSKETAMYRHDFISPPQRVGLAGGRSNWLECAPLPCYTYGPLRSRIAVTEDALYLFLSPSNLNPPRRTAGRALINGFFVWRYCIAENTWTLVVKSK